MSHECRELVQCRHWLQPSATHLAEIEFASGVEEAWQGSPKAWAGEGVNTLLPTLWFDETWSALRSGSLDNEKNT